MLEELFSELFNNMTDEEYLKFCFGLLFEDEENINALFHLMEKDLKIKSFVEVDIDPENDGSYLRQVGLTNDNEFIVLRMQFNYPTDDEIEYDVIIANKLCNMIKELVSVKSLIICIDDAVEDRFKHFKVGDNDYIVEICSFKDIDGEKYLLDLKKKVGVE